MTAFASTARFAATSIDRRAGLFYAGIVVASIPIWPFAWHLALHVLGAVFLIGNAVVMAVWLTIAGVTGSDDAKRRAARVVNVADAWLTVPGVLLLLANGVALVNARYGGFPAVLAVDFVVLGLGLLVATGAVWAFRLLPIQLQLLRLGDAPALDVAAFKRLLNQWYGWGTLATVMPIIAVIVMSTKPDLW